MDTIRELADRITKAKVPEDIFGKMKGTDEEKVTIIGVTYRNMVKIVHPDKYATEKDLLKLAQTAFVKLSQLKRDAEHKIEGGTYGDGKPVEPPPSPPTEPIVVKVRKQRFTVNQRLFQGDICDLYACDIQDELPKKAPKEKNAWDLLMDAKPEDNYGPVRPAIFKIATNASNNDLVENEFRILTHMYPVAQVEEKNFRYLPKPFESFMLRGSTGTNRRVNVLQKFEDYVSLQEILKAFPGGIDSRDMVWMFKRILVGIGFAHTKGVVHGAILPPHVIVHPKEHGARILDWCYAIKTEGGKERVRAMAAKWQPYYAPEILAKQAPTPATDVYMAAKCAVALLGGDVATNKMPASVSGAIRGFIESCLIAAPHRRPDDAWRLHEEFDALLLRTVGKPKYRLFQMPPRT